ncbi:DUF5004 domain-containing protein [Carboxylicivirga sp. A043]|uniref:DUF5004 domain-containing protein n=1 Tax=Carboxylicivirga litoralis TaxID=2816963 RepID=UPI0021CB0863|nr:DUF5004 domain-containing protein [Carboxylicivirga sp. A043]MCU4156538.1 DUF5004 domain-containing protein [Carboxylicivirga sp. A043]
MKKTCIYVLLFLLVLPFEGCYQTDDGSYVAPITIYEKINGSWSLDELTLVDEYAKSNAITPDNEVLTSFFNFQNFNIQFNVDASNQPTTFEVTGDVPALFLMSGYWSLSSSYPNTNLSAVRINLYADAAKTQIVDQLRLTSIPGAQDVMEIQLVRASSGTAFASYVFNLSPAN